MRIRFEKAPAQRRGFFFTAMASGLPLACGVALFAYIACVPRPAAEHHHWVPVPNAHATHFRLLTDGGALRAVVLGHGGVGDTVSDVVLSRPFERLAIASTTHAAFIHALGCTDRIVGCAATSGARDPDLRRAIDEGRVVEIGTADGLDRERLIALKPDVVFGYPFGGAGSGLAETGVQVVQVSEYLEEHPLGRAEWVRFFGALLGRAHAADSLFQGISERYEALRTPEQTDSLPTVLFGSVWKGQWWVPPGNSYMARLIHDAGGRYLFDDRIGEGNLAMDMETMIALGSSADWWGMIAAVEGHADVRTFTNCDSRLNGFKAVRNDHLFLGDPDTEDLFGQALLEPDAVLSTLRALFDPRFVVDGPPGERRVYFRVLHAPRESGIATDRAAGQ